ncbi:MAG: endonuclease MutS2 [candidate division WOR-3 bacterium]|nr:endonuclease MutS2 [candidate division WOR-3 bacterium]MCR4423259.1 endonuclease MutS2 [candidate division WOR-3 bacterium]MDH7518598.1 endonuclease MutS2 [bacterium]
MDRETLEALDFPRVWGIIVDLCQTELGKEKARQAGPFLDRDAVQKRLDQLEEIINFAGEPSLAGVRNIRVVVDHAKAGAMLSADELLSVRATCRCLAECQDFFRKNQKHIVHLGSIASGITAIPVLERAIERAIDDSGAVRDTASPRLKELRDEMRSRRNSLVDRLERMIEENPDWFEGPVMVRRERFVLPVKLEYRNQVSGVVHGVSSSGQTVFIEPMESIVEQNYLQELRDAETEEVNRILRELSGLVAHHHQELNTGMEMVAELDFLLAKRRFSTTFGCTRPMLSADGTLALVQARHPLLVLHKKEVVPLDFFVPDRTVVVLISGPNAGGKTVVLKTLGICALLLKSGMFIPAATGTKLPWWEQVFADIGDEQSLETHRSSFTAHLLRLKEILAYAGGNSLVLIDEIGAATAPEEGTALAIAVLEELRHRGLITVATTHFNSLKMFVQNEPGMSNAAMEFRNGPTYRLIMGVPGESSAFEIAEQMGLPPRLLERARMFLGKEWLDLSAKLRAVEEELHKLRIERQQIEMERSQASELIATYQKRHAEFEKWRQQEERHIQEEKERILKEARRQVENLVRELRERNADRQSVVNVKKFIEDNLAELKKDSASVENTAGEVKPEFAIGDLVESKIFRRRGRVTEIKGNDVVVAFGQVKMTVPAETLVIVKQNLAETSILQMDEFEFVPRLNIRGMTREEAEEALDQFLAEAEAAGAKELSILHGKGTGTLRQMLWRRLRKDQRVSEVRFAEPREGGMGVTLVRLRGNND